MNGLRDGGVAARTASIKILILSGHGNLDGVMRSSKPGPGFVLKESPAEELMRAVETVQAGQTYFSSEVARVALNQFVRAGTFPAWRR